jgi:hypothetical protein
MSFENPLYRKPFFIDGLPRRSKAYFMQLVRCRAKAKPSKGGPRKGKPIWVDGHWYPSMAQASRETKISVGTLRKRANDPSDSKVYFGDPA